MSHMEAFIVLFVLNTGVDFHKRKRTVADGTRIRTCMTHGGNGKNIGPLKENLDDSKSMKMRHSANDGVIDFMCELQNGELKVFVKHQHFCCKCLPRFGKCSFVTML